MKHLSKLLIGAVLSLSQIGCSTNDGYTYTLVYEIHWSGNFVETKTLSQQYPIQMDSYRGSNFVKCNGKTIEETTAPIRVVSYTKTKNDNE